MAIPSNRLFEPYDPLKDFLNREDTIVLGGVWAPKDLQAAIIDANLDQTDPTIFSLGPRKRVPRPFSKREICKIAIDDKVFIRKAAIALAICALGVYFWKWSVSSVMNYYKKYTEGCLIRVYYRGIPSPPRPLALHDIVGWGFELAVLNIICNLLFCLLPVYNAINALQKRISSAPKHRVGIAELEKIPSSGALLSGKVVDCFSKKPIFLSEAKQPKMLTVGQHTGDLWEMINQTLSKERPSAHPLEDRGLTWDEIRKFENDVESLLIIRDFRTTHSIKKPEERKKRFFECLPKSTIEKYNLKERFSIQ